MLFGDLPRGTSIKPANEIIYCEDGIHLKRIPVSMIFPEATVAVEPIIKTGVEIARIGINGNSVSIYAPGAPENVLVGARVNGRDVVRNGIAEVTVPVTDVQVDGVSKVSGRIANIRIPVKGVVDGDGESLVDGNGIAHVTGGGGGTGDVVDVVDEDGVSLLDANKIAHVSGKAPTIIQPTLEYDDIVGVEESKTWTIGTQYTWTAEDDCVIFMKNTPNYMYKLGSLTSWLHGIGMDNGPFGRAFIPLAKGTTITIQMKNAYTSGSPIHLYYIPYTKVNAISSPVVQPYPDYENIADVSYTSSVSTNQIFCEYTATKPGILVPNVSFTSTRYELNFSINDTFTQYCVPYNTNFDILDGIPLKTGDTIKFWFGTTGTVSGDIKFVPFLSADDISNVKSPIPNWDGSITQYSRTALPATLDAGYWINEQIASYSSSGNYPINYTVPNVSGTFTIDNYYSDGGTYDNLKPGKIYATGSEVLGTVVTANYLKAYVVPMVNAEVDYGKEKTYKRTLLYSGTAATTAISDITLNDEINKFDDIEFCTSVASNNVSTYFNVQRVDVEYFISKFPYNSSASSSTWQTVPHFLVCPYSGNYYRAIMGQTNNKIRIFQKSGTPIINEIYGINY